MQFPGWLGPFFRDLSNQVGAGDMCHAIRRSSFLTASLMLLLSGCRVLGPLSPLRPVEQVLIYPQSIAPSQSSEVKGDGAQVWIETDRGQFLEGRYVRHPNPQAVALYCHGNIGTVDKWSVLAGRLSRMHRMSVLAFDYPGYGRSEGRTNERNILKDAEAARAWLARENGIRESDIVLIGRSLGGAVAVDLAASKGARGLILESTFSSLPDVAEYHAAWLFPEWNMTQRMNSVEKIRNYSGPLLQSHGDADRVVPIALGKELFDAAPGRKQFIVAHGGNHNDDHIRYCSEVREKFLRSLPPVQRVELSPTEAARSSIMVVR